jgi:hypothetical protein
MRIFSRHLPHATRLAAFVMASALVASIVAVRQARAQVNEGMRRLARQLMPYAEQGAVETPRRVVINGETVYLATGLTRDSVTAVLDYYEAQCARRGGRTTETLNDGQRAQLAGAAFNQLWTQAPMGGARIESMREGDEREGYVICVDTGGQRVGFDELTRRLQEVLRTGDLSRWGDLRYAYVTRRPTGTRILTVATEGRFNLLGMFPSEGDAPGQDVPGLPRYPGMRRVVSAHEEGQPNGLGMYTVAAPMAAVRDWYRREMGRHGWQLAEAPPEGKAPALDASVRDRTLLFSRGNAADLMLVFDHAEGTTSMMSLLAQ